MVVPDDRPDFGTDGEALNTGGARCKCLRVEVADGEGALAEMQ